MNQLIILGSGSALPTTLRNPTAQVLQSDSENILIDCGEGAQLRLRECKISFSKISIILISHLHGDHFFGLPGVLSSFNLLGRTKPITIIGPEGIKEILQLQFKHSKTFFNYSINYIELNEELKEPKTIITTKHLIISTFSLNHRIDCYGYLIREKPKERKLIKSELESYKIPIAFRRKIKQGADYINENNEVIPNEKLTHPPLPSKSYAFCSDNRIQPNQLNFLENIDYLYHEATFEDDLKSIAQKTMHSTAKETAELAKALNVKKLFIGHFSSRYNNIDHLEKEAQNIFPNTVAVNDKSSYLL